LISFGPFDANESLQERPVERFSGQGSSTNHKLGPPTRQCLIYSPYIGIYNESARIHHPLLSTYWSIYGSKQLSQISHFTVMQRCWSKTVKYPSFREAASTSGREPRGGADKMTCQWLERRWRQSAPLERPKRLDRTPLMAVLLDSLTRKSGGRALAPSLCWSPLRSFFALGCSKC
jgi:hypothetical protein